MWKVAHACVRGESHIRDNIPCQDSCHAQKHLSDHLVALAISDGAGSAQFAEEGSRLVVSHLLENIVAPIFEGISTPEEADRMVSDLIKEEALDWVAECQEVIKRKAEEVNCSVAEFSATLLFAILGPTEAIFLQIGDGAWVGQFNGFIGAITWPYSGEYASQTCFVTSPRAPDHMQFVKCASPNAVAGFSDGIERLVLDMQRQIPFDQFFAPLFSFLNKIDDIAKASADLSQFLTSKQVCDQTDDDKSIVIATQDAVDS